MSEGSNIVKAQPGGMEKQSTTVSNAPSSSVPETNIAAAEVKKFSEVLSTIEFPSSEPRMDDTQVKVSSQGQGSSGKSDADDRTAALYAKLPEQKIMVRKIEAKFQKEIHLLLKKAHGGLSRNVAKGKAYELNEVVSQIRKIRAILAHLAYATLEYIRKLFMQLFGSQAKSA